MPDLEEQLRGRLRGRVLLAGLGSREWGDDALGLCLAGELAEAGWARVLVAERGLEACLPALREGECDHVVFLDAVEFGGRPGSVAFLEAAALEARYPQVSTHRLSLGLMARWIATERGASVWLLGVQPATLRASRGLSPEVRHTLDLLKETLARALGGPRRGAGVEAGRAEVGA